MSPSPTDKGRVSRGAGGSDPGADFGVRKNSVFDARAAAWRCDKASPGAAVMLHLRFCYVSKAAILTVPVHVVPTENRSPA